MFFLFLHSFEKVHRSTPISKLTFPTTGRRFGRKYERSNEDQISDLTMKLSNNKSLSIVGKNILRPTSLHGPRSIWPSAMILYIHTLLPSITITIIIIFVNRVKNNGGGQKQI